LLHLMKERERGTRKGLFVQTFAQKGRPLSFHLPERRKKKKRKGLTKREVYEKLQKKGKRDRKTATQLCRSCSLPAGKKKKGKLRMPSPPRARRRKKANVLAHEEGEKKKKDRSQSNFIDLPG